MSTTRIYPNTDAGVNEFTATGTPHCDQVNEDVSNIVWSTYVSTTNASRTESYFFTLPAQDIESVQVIRDIIALQGETLFPWLIGLRVDVFVNDVLRATHTLNADTMGEQVLVFCDLAVTGFSQTDANIVRIDHTTVRNDIGEEYEPPQPYEP